jgi:hypothetical protein
MRLEDPGDAVAQGVALIPGLRCRNLLIVRPEKIRTDGAEIELGTARIREATFQGAHHHVSQARCSL